MVFFKAEKLTAKVPKFYINYTFVNNLFYILRASLNGDFFAVGICCSYYSSEIGALSSHIKRHYEVSRFRVNRVYMKTQVLPENVDVGHARRQSN